MVEYANLGLSLTVVEANSLVGSRSTVGLPALPILVDCGGTASPGSTGLAAVPAQRTPPPLWDFSTGDFRTVQVGNSGVEPTPSLQCRLAGRS